MNYSDILLECINIAKDRQTQYGEATESVTLGAKMVDDMFGWKLTPKQFCEVMIAGKFAREKKFHKKDNTVDSINYMAIRECV